MLIFKRNDIAVFITFKLVISKECHCYYHIHNRHKHKWYNKEQPPQWYEFNSLASFIARICIKIQHKYKYYYENAWD
jgi:hypothetical protein